MKLLELYEQRNQLIKQAEAKNGTGTLTDADVEEIDSLLQKADELKTQIDAVEKREAVQGRVSSAVQTLSKPGERQITPRITDMKLGLEEDPKGGFTHFGEFAKSVLRSSGPGRQVDLRLAYRLEQAAPTTYGTEATGADGGFAVPSEFSREIMELAMMEDALLPYCQNTQVEGNTLTIPTSEDTAWGSGGVTAYWVSEAGAITESKPALKEVTLRLKKIACLVPASDELQEDSAAIATFIPRKMAEAIRYKANDAIFQGTGAGVPLGITSGNNAAYVEATKDTSQTATTITATNISIMFSRLTSNAGRNRAVWLVSHTAWGQLVGMKIGDTPIWLPPGTPMHSGFMAAPIGMTGNNTGGILFGRPVIIFGACSALGTAKDIVCADLGSYYTITKASGPRLDTSIHLYFDYGATAWRLQFRMDGRPAYSSTITAANGSTTLAPTVWVETRS